MNKVEVKVEVLLRACLFKSEKRETNPVMQATTVQLNTIDVVRCCLGNAEGKPSRCDIHHEN